MPREKEKRSLILDEYGVNVDSGFKLGTTNADESIARLTHINGHNVKTLEERMRPNKYEGVGPGIYSYDGFLGPEESLLGEMLYCNKLVRDMGLTHQEIADLLFEVIDNHNKGERVYEKNGMRFEVGYMRTVSDGQMSPFSNSDMPHDIEGEQWRGEVSVLNLDTGRTIWFPPQLPRWIWNMGFYEGRGSSYHLDPVALVDLFTRKDRIFLTHKEFAEKKGKELKKDGIKLVGLSIPSEIAKQRVSEDAVARLEKIGNDGKIILESKCSSYRIFTAYNDSVYNRFGCGILILGKDGEKILSAYNTGECTLGYDKKAGRLSTVLEEKNGIVAWAKIYDKPNENGWTVTYGTNDALTFGFIFEEASKMGSMMMEYSDKLASYGNKDYTLTVQTDSEGSWVKAVYLTGKNCVPQKFFLEHRKNIQAFVGSGDEKRLINRITDVVARGQYIEMKVEIGGKISSIRLDTKGNAGSNW